MSQDIASAPASPTWEELVEAMVDAWNDAYEAEYFTDGTAKDNRATAMRAALAIAEPIISAQARAKALEEAAAGAHQAWLDGVPVAEISKEIFKLKDRPHD